MHKKNYRIKGGKSGESGSIHNGIPTQHKNYQLPHLAMNRIIKQ